jgi:hydroxyacylglutathione hydrolase
MFFEHIYDKSLAQGSYLVGCQATGEAIVIDAKRDIDTYLQIAAQNNLRITHITETHIHADYLCGSRELAVATGADMYLSDEGGPDWQYEFPHIGLKDGSIINVGNLTLEVMHTPGHTPESISFLLTDHPASDEPVMIFTGDFVFVGDVGRPDLLEKAAGIIGTKEEGAKQMYHSLERFAALPDHIQVWPAHGAGSACGKSLGAVSSTTVGYEKIRNWALQFGEDEEGFTEALLDGQPEPPKYFAMMKKLNKVDRPLLVEVPKPKKLTKDEFLKAYKEGMKVIDTRTNLEFGKAHLANTLNVRFGNSFSTWMGWVMNYQEEFILIAQEEHMEELTRMLMRIGMDNIYGFITDITDLGEVLVSSDLIDINEFENLIGKENVQILDVRNHTEHQSGMVDGATPIFVGVLEDNLDKVSKDKQIVVHCLSGYRSSLATSILERNGFTNVKNYLGGMQEWKEKQKPLSCVTGMSCS